MKIRIVLILVVALIMGSWVNPAEKTQTKAKDSVARMAPKLLVKKPAKKGIKLLFESVLYHFM